MGQTFVTAAAPRNRADMIGLVRKAGKQSNRTAAQNSLDAIIAKAAKKAVEAALAKPRATTTANAQGFDWASVLPPGDEFEGVDLNAPIDEATSTMRKPAQTGGAFDWASTLPKE